MIGFNNECAITDHRIGRTVESVQIEKVNILHILLFILSLFILVVPNSFYGLTTGIISAWKTIQLGLFVVLLFLYIIKVFELNRTLLSILVYLFFDYGLHFLLDSHNVSISEPLIRLSVLVLVILGYRRSRKNLYISVNLFFASLLLLQFILQLVLKKSLFVSGTGIFPNKNYLVRFFLPAPLFSVLLYDEFKIKINKVWICLTYLITGLIVLFSDSQTGVIGYFVYIVVSLLLTKKRIPKHFTLGVCATISIAVFCLIYFCNIQNYFEFFIVDVLHKNTTLTGRTEIWDKAFAIIFGLELEGITILMRY